MPRPVLLQNFKNVLTVPMLEYGYYCPSILVLWQTCGGIAFIRCMILSFHLSSNFLDYRIKYNILQVPFSGISEKICFQYINL